MNFLFMMWLSLFMAWSHDTSVFDKDTSDYKALVFLSDECPCSRSHIDHLNSLSQSGLKVFGVISEPLNDSMSEERKKQLTEYFKPDKFSFPLIDDPQQLLVKKYKALKTPHVTLFKKTNTGYEIIYEGGVTNQKDFHKSSQKYLAENWQAITAGRPLKYARGHSLGCYIRRF